MELNVEQIDLWATQEGLILKHGIEMQNEIG